MDVIAAEQELRAMKEIVGVHLQLRLSSSELESHLLEHKMNSLKSECSIGNSAQFATADLRGLKVLFED